METIIHPEPFPHIINSLIAYLSTTLTVKTLTGKLKGSSKSSPLPQSSVRKIFDITSIRFFSKQYSFSAKRKWKVLEIMQRMTFRKRLPEKSSGSLNYVG